MCDLVVYLRWSYGGFVIFTKLSQEVTNFSGKLSLGNEYYINDKANQRGTKSIELKKNNFEN